MAKKQDNSGFAQLKQGLKEKKPDCLFNFLLIHNDTSPISASYIYTFDIISNTYGYFTTRKRLRQFLFTAI